MTDTPETFLDYARRGRSRHWFRWIATGIVAIVFALVLQIIVFVALAAWLCLHQGLQVQAALQKLLELAEKPTNPPVFFLLAGVLFGCYLVGLWLAARLIQNKRFGDLIGRWRWDLFVLGAVIWMVLVAAGTAVDWFIAPKGFTLTLSAATLPLAAAAIAGLSVQTFTEEFIFRGWVAQGWLLATKNPVATAILAALMFGSVHLSNPPDGLLAAASATVFGFATTLIAIRTRSLAFGFGMHLANNFWDGVVVVSTNDVFKGAPGIFTQHTNGLAWSDVGVEAVCLALVTVLVYARTRPIIPKQG
ncbi:MAG TPA: type II CAAX endopeptidase family protein [Caulobacteraceae bacterium]|jgi:hypothetical protein